MRSSETRTAWSLWLNVCRDCGGTARFALPTAVPVGRSGALPTGCFHTEREATVALIEEIETTAREQIAKCRERIAEIDKGEAR